MVFVYGYDPDAVAASMPTTRRHAPKLAYHCAEGHFLQTDPVGYEAGDLNLYAYVRNDPINYFDPTGRDAVVLTTRPFFANFRHQAILIGNDREGWAFTSREGYGQFRAAPGGIYQDGARTVGASFATLRDALTSQMLAPYTENYRHAATSEQDRAMMGRIEAVIAHDYDFIFCNCGDLVRAALMAGGISFPSSINPDATLPHMRTSSDWTRVSRVDLMRSTLAPLQSDNQTPWSIDGDVITGSRARGSRICPGGEAGETC